jgi:acetyl-CoA C-acetyltransferase
MDVVALRSHNNAERATQDGSFKAEIIPLEIPQRKKEPIIFDKDEHFRPGLTMADLQKLPPAFVPQIGKVTAGNSSGINDGSAALVIMSAQTAAYSAAGQNTGHRQRRLSSVGHGIGPDPGGKGSS